MAKSSFFQKSFVEHLHRIKRIVPLRPLRKRGRRKRVGNGDERVWAEKFFFKKVWLWS
jgi:hypothetical protein